VEVKQPQRLLDMGVNPDGNGWGPQGPWARAPPQHWGFPGGAAAPSRAIVPYLIK